MIRIYMSLALLPAEDPELFLAMSHAISAPKDVVAQQRPLVWISAALLLVLVMLRILC